MNSWILSSFHSIEQQIFKQYIPYDHAPWNQNMQFLLSFARMKEDFGPVP